MAYNPSNQSRQQPLPRSNPSQLDGIPHQFHPVHPSYDASVPRDIPRQGQFASQETPGHFYNPGSAPQYGTTPPQPYGTSPSRQQMYGISPPRPQEMYGTSPSQQQYLAPSSSQPGYPTQPQSSYGYSPQQTAYNEPPHPRARASSTASYQSYSSHRSGHSKRSRYDDKESRRKNSRVSSPPRPSFGDTMVLMWGSIKGAFDTRK